MSGSRFAVSVTWSTDSTMASITPPTEDLDSTSMSSAHNWVPKPLMRTQSVFPSSSQRTTLRRAAALPLGATASSMSSTTMSARDPAAGPELVAWAPLTRSQLRARTGSMRNPTSWVSCASHPLTWSYIVSSWALSVPQMCSSIVAGADVDADTRSVGAPAPAAGATLRCGRTTRSARARGDGAERGAAPVLAAANSAGDPQGCRRHRDRRGGDGVVVRRRLHPCAGAALPPEHARRRRRRRRRHRTADRRAAEQA